MNCTVFPKSLVKQIRIPSQSEWEEAVATVPNIPVSIDGSSVWWLSGPGSTIYFAYGVNSRDGSVMKRVNIRGMYGVRPLFVAGSPSFKPGEKYKVGRCVCTAISVSALLADYIVFNATEMITNLYECSYIKEKLEDPEFLSDL